MIRKSCFAILVCAAGALAAASSPAGQDATAQAKAVLAELPLRFEANQGQFAPAVRYAARAGGYLVRLDASGASLHFADSRQVHLSFLQSNSSPAIEPADLLPTHTDYLIGPRQNWHLGIASYASVRYRSVYPGIDVVYYGKQNQLEYDFVLRSGADPKDIRLQFTGAGRLQVTPEGDLVLDTGRGRLLQKKPAIYQQEPNGSRRPIPGRYVLLADNVAGIEPGRYDRSRELVIDPSITYSTLIGGSLTDEVTAVKLMPNGKLYVGGWTQTGEVLTTDIDFTELTDCFVQIVDTTASGQYGVLYFTYLGGSETDQLLALDVDAAGFIYLAGTTDSTDFPLSGAFQTTGATSTYDAFLSKLDPNQAGTGNSLVFSSYLGGTIGDEQAHGVAVGTGGIAYLIGTTKSPDFPITDNAYAASLYGNSDCFLAQIDTIGGVLLYSTFFGSELDDEGRGIVLAPNGLVYFVATTAGTQFPAAGASYHPTAYGNYDITVGAFDLTKSGVDSLVYGTYFGGSMNDEARGIALDAQGRLLITGYTLSPDFPVTPATALQPTYQGNGDAFVAIVDLTKSGNGFLVYSSFLGGSQGEVGYGIAGDSAGYVYVTGYTLSPDFPTAGNVPQFYWGGGIDMFILRMNPKVAGLASLDYSTYLGTQTTLLSCCITVGADGRTYVAGSSDGYLPLVGNSAQGYYGGGLSDGFFLVMSPGTGFSGVILPATRVEERPSAPAHGIPPRTIRRK